MKGRTMTDDSSSTSTDVTLAAALTAEHDAIDAGIEAFVASAEAEGPITRWAAPLQEAMQALRRHIYIEEEVVFPRLRKGPLTMPIMVMYREHGEIWRAMDELDAHLASAEGDDSVVRTELVEGCNHMLELLEQHNLKEEPIIYPHLDSDLDETAKAQLRDLMDNGKLPEGWVCEKA